MGKRRFYRRPHWLLTLEIISVIPFELLLELFIVLNYKHFCYVYSLHGLKVCRIFHHLYFRATLMDIALWMPVTIFTLFCVYVGTICYAIAFKIHCLNSDCVQLNKLEYYNNIISKFTTWGFSISIPDVHVEILIIIIGPIYTYISRGIIMGMVLIDNYSLWKQRYVYKNTLRQCKTLMNMIKVPRQLRDELNNFYDMLWAKRRGYHYDKDIFNIVPEAMRLEIMLDMYCVALKHSILFRDSNPSLMRFLTANMHQNFYCNGENVYVKGSVKNKLVYIVSGIVQILSDEDDESPLFSLSAGTCIGETSLLMTQICKFTIRCKNFVETHILYRADFLKMINLYPDEYGRLLNRVKERYEEVKGLNILARHFNKIDSYNFNKDHITMIWLKDILKTLMTDNDKMFDTNLYLQEENRAENLQRYFFTSNYLDLLVMARKVEVTDCEIIKTDFPFVFHPNSFVIKLWNFLIIVCVCYAAIVIPFYLFRNRQSANVDLPLLTICTFIFIIDIFVKLSTAVLTKEGVYKTIKSICQYKVRTIEFKVELVAAFPLEVFCCLIIVENGLATFVFMRINRLLKLWFVWRYITELEEKHRMYLHVIYYAKMILFGFYLIFVFGCIFYSSSCSSVKNSCANENRIWSWYTSIQLVTGVGIRGPYDQEYYFGIIYNVLLHISSLLMAMAYVYITCSILLLEPNFYWVQTLIEEIEDILHKYGVRSTSTDRVVNYIETNWQYNEAIDLMDEYKIQNEVPATLYHNTIEQSYFSILKNVKFFQNLDESILYAMSSKILTTILPPNELVCREGDFTDRLLILKDGICEISERKLHKYDVINPLVFVYQLTTLRTCYTKTHCVILTIKHDDFIKQFRKFNVEYESFMNTIETTSDFKAFLQHYSKAKFKEETLDAIKTPNIYYFGYDYELDSIEEYEYHVPFDRLGNFKFIRYLLQRFTIDPNGRLFFVYECFRGFFAILSGLCHSMVLFAVSDNNKIPILLYGLDAFAYLDLYIMLHVCYHDDRGILVKHPLFTAKRYLTNSFLLDLFAVFPFEVFKRSNVAYVRILLHFNRLLQLHRYVGLTNYLWLRSCKKKPYIFHLHYLPIVFIMITAFASMFASIVCDFDVTDTSKEAKRCNMNDLGINPTKNNNNNLNALYIQIHCIYLMSSAVNAIGINEAPIRTITLAIFISICTIIGTLYTYSINGLLTIYSGMGSTMKTFYESSYRHLIVHLKRRGFDGKFLNEIFRYVDLRWKRHSGRSKLIASKLYFTIRQDILHEVYMNTFENSMFRHDGVLFFRCLLMEAVHDTFAKGNYINCYGDISDKIYIVHRGSVNICDKYGQLFGTIFTGGIFGSLLNHEYNKIIVDSVATTDVELIIIKTDYFYRQIERHSHIKVQFIDLLGVHKFFIPSLINDDKIIVVNERIKSDKCLNYIDYVIREGTLNPESPFMSVWNKINFIASYISIVAYFFQMGLDEFGIGLVFIQYLTDVIYIVDFVLKDHVMYLDKRGHWVSFFFNYSFNLLYSNILINSFFKVKNVREIKRRRRSKRFNFFISVIALLPLELWVYVVPFTIRNKELYLKIFRLNRLLRLETLFAYYHREIRNIKRNLFIFDLNFSNMMFLLHKHSLTCFLIWYASFFESNMSYHIGNVRDMTFLMKLKLYVKYFYVIFTIISRIAQDIYYPLRYELLIFFIIIMSFAPITTTWICLKLFDVSMKLNRLKILFRSKVEVMNYFMQREEISDYIAMKTQRYINMLWIKQRGIIIPDLLLQAPTYFTHTYFIKLYMGHLNGHKMFGKCSLDFKRQLITQITIDYYYDQDYITYKNLINNSMYFIHEGNVSIYDEIDKDTEILIGELKCDNCFGLMQGYKYSLPHKFNYKARTNCVALCLNYNRWKYLIDFFPFDRIIIERAYSLIDE